MVQRLRDRGGRRLLAVALVVAAGCTTLWWGTDGFRAYTSEAVRRLRVLREPAVLPDVRFQDQNGSEFSLADYREHLVAVEFIYTRCESICRSLGMLFGQLQERFPSWVFDHDLSLLSISFDYDRDDVSALKGYADAFGADGHVWRIARVRNSGDLALLMKAFGVVAIDDGLGGFEHNAALYLVDRDGRLRQIEDYDREDRFEQTIRSLL